jgi:hypothetical protein
VRVQISTRQTLHHFGEQIKSQNRTILRHRRNRCFPLIHHISTDVSVLGRIGWLTSQQAERAAAHAAQAVVVVAQQLREHLQQARQLGVQCTPLSAAIYHSYAVLATIRAVSAC